MQLPRSALISARQCFIWLGLTHAARLWYARSFRAKTVALHCEPAGRIDWHGSLRRVALSRAGAERAGSRGTADAGAVCQAVRKNQQERLH